GALSRLKDSQRLTVGDMLTLWLNTAKVRVAPSTYERYDQQVRLHLRKYLGSVLLAKFAEDHVWELFNRMRGAGSSESECHMMGKVLRSVLKLAAQRKLILFNPALNVPLPKTVKADIRPLDLEQSR